MGYGGYPIAPGGAGTPGTDGKDAFTTTYAAFTWGNANEDLFFQVPAGSVDFLAPLQWISISDGVHAGYLTVIEVGAVDPEAPEYQLVHALDNGTSGNPVNTVIGSGAIVAVAGKPGAAGAAGATGGANISGTANKLIKFSGATTGADSRITDDGATVTVVADPGAGKGLIVQVDGVAATAGGGGVALANTTSTTSPAASVQRSPPLALKARARVSSVDTGFVFDFQFIPTTGGNWQLLMRKSTDGGATFSEVGRFTNATPSQVVQALYNVSGFSAGDGSVGFYFETDFGGMFRGGSGDLQLLARAAALAMLLRSPTTTSGQASFRMWANGGTRGAGEALLEVGDVAAGFVRRFAVMGDGSVLCRVPVTVDTTTALTVAATDSGKLFTTSNAGAVTVNLPAGSTGLWYRFKNKGVGAATLTPNGSEKLFTTVQVANIAMVTGDAKTIAWDGTDWCVL